MDVLVVLEGLGIGGTEQAMVYLVPELRRLGVRCDIAVLTEDLRLRQRVEEAGACVHPLAVSHRWSLVEGARGLARLWRKKRYDIVHSKLFFSGLCNGLDAALHGGPPRVASFHNVVYDYPGLTKKDYARRELEGFFMRNYVEGFAALSNAVAKSYRGALRLKAPVEVIPNAVPVTELRSGGAANHFEVCRRLRLNTQSPIVAMPARLVFEKDHDTFIRGIERLHGQGIDVQAVIAGRGPLGQRIAEQVKASSARSRFSLFLDGLTPNESRQLMDAASVVAVPSILEGFGLAPIEAMSLGTPVVVAASTGLLDVVEPEISGLMFPVGDVDAFAKALRRALTDPELRETLSVNGRRRVEAHFSTIAVAEKWEALYRKTCRHRGASRLGPIRRCLQKRFSDSTK